MGIIFFVLVGFYICTLCIGAPVDNSRRWKKKIGMGCREGWNPHPVRGVCGYLFLGISCVGSWLSHGDSILLFVPCGPGSVRGCESISAILLCYITFGLVPVGRHRWACLFWLVTRTNARRCSFRCVYVSWLGHFWSLFLVLLLFLCFFLISESLLFLSQQSAVSCPGLFQVNRKRLRQTLSLGQRWCVRGCHAWRRHGGQTIWLTLGTWWYWQLG